MPCRGAAIAWSGARLLAILCAAAALLTIAGCAAGHAGDRSGGFVPFAQPTAPRAATPVDTQALRAQVAGHWEITSFEQHGKAMDTCLGEDASIDFASDGTWVAHNRADGHTYGGAYTFNGVNGLALTAGQYQQYTVTLADDAMTLLGGRALRITLQRSASSAQQDLTGSIEEVSP